MLSIRAEDADRCVRPPEPQEAEQAKRDLRVLARPRLTGSDGAQEVEAELRERFRELGYDVRDLPFTYSELGGRFAFSIAGAVGVLGSVVALIATLSGSPLVGVLSAWPAALFLAAVVRVSTRGTSRLPWGRRKATNLLAVRPATRPRWVVVAHRDSKSQFLPTALRGLASVAAGLSLIGLGVLSALGFASTALLWHPLLWVLGSVAIVGFLGVALSWASDDSPGALDNATGLAALLGVAAREREADDVAFLVTDAEEQGLAGARSAAGALKGCVGAINVDCVDDEGPFILVERHGWPKRRGAAPHIAAAVMAAADALDLPLQRTDLPPTILVDHVALVEGGMPAVTIARGTTASLRVLHTPFDATDRVSGDGIAPSIALVSGVLALLRLPTAPRQPVLPDSLRPRGRQAGG